jgi:hypothetical protein
MEVVHVGENGAGIIPFEAFGVRMWVAANRPEARERLPEVLPPDRQPCEGWEAEYRLAIIGDERGTYSVDLGSSLLTMALPLDLALETLAGVVRSLISRDAPDRIFVHAGVVAYGGSAILIPGSSFTGKTTLVAALVRAGAIYYSDEFAPLDAEGLVHPYAKPLSLRGAEPHQTGHRVESLGGIAGQVPLPVGAVVETTYRPGTEWRPERLSGVRGCLALLSHTIPARDRPAQALHAIARAVDGAILLAGDRGDAEAIAPMLLAELESRTT